jgi:hypothetical protein
VKTAEVKIVLGLLITSQKAQITTAIEQSRLILETLGVEKTPELHHIPDLDCPQFDILSQRCNPMNNPRHWHQERTGEYQALVPIRGLLSVVEELENLLANYIDNDV